MDIGIGLVNMSVTYFRLFIFSYDTILQTKWYVIFICLVHSWYIWLSNVWHDDYYNEQLYARVMNPNSWSNLHI